jgi:Fe-S cluster assembly protein SufD
MPKRTDVIANKRVSRHTQKDFSFTREMAPYISGNGAVPEFIKNYHANAWDVYAGLPIPSTSDEPWRRTSLRSMPAGDFRYIQPGENKRENITSPPPEILAPVVGDSLGGQILLSPEITKVGLNQELIEQGVVFVDLATAVLKYPGLLEKVLGQIVEPKEGKFAALSAALSDSGVLVYVPAGVKVELPLHSVFWRSGSNQAYFSHILVWLEQDSSLTYVHESTSPTEKNGHSMHAGIVEIHIGSGANLRFVEMQSWGKHVWNFSHERAHVGRDATLDWVFGAVGSHLTKNFTDLNLVGQGASGRMSGFYFTDGVQHMDHDTQQNHLALDTTSDLLFKGALTERSRSVWQGMIYVAPGAQKTDGYQANRNIVLDSSARADSIPGLEILANDVRCSHGATVGKIDKDQVFYLQSRGIPYDDAVRIIVEGFFDPIMQRIPFDGVRTRFQNVILEKMGNI